MPDLFLLFFTFRPRLRVIARSKATAAIPRTDGRIPCLASTPVSLRGAKRRSNPLNVRADSLPPLSSQREEWGRWIAAQRQDGRGKHGRIPCPTTPCLRVIAKEQSGCGNPLNGRAEQLLCFDLQGIASPKGSQ
jgi:hypothetical protein